MGSRIKLEPLTLGIAIVFNLLFIAYAAWEYYESFAIYGDRGRLPQPFSRFRMDIFMDYYNVNFHALTSTFYTGEFNSVYSGLFRLFGFLFTSNECSVSLSAMDLRACDSSLYYWYLLGVPLIFYLFIKIAKNYEYKYFWGLLFITSFPFLYMLERGNYIIFSIILISLIALTNNQKIFNFTLTVLPFTKFYFITLYFILLKQGFQKLLIYLSLYIGLHTVFILYFNDGFFDQFKNIIDFTAKPYNIFEVLVATTIRPLAKYTQNPIFVLVAQVFIVFLIIRMYLYLSIFLENNLQLENYKYLVMVCLLFMIIVIDAIGFYAIALLYPFFSYFIGKHYFSMIDKILIILICIPYPINLLNFQHLQYENVYVHIQVQSIIIPLLLIILFMKFTSSIRYQA